jgi:microcystin degradation protein MlrC
MRVGIVSLIHESNTFISLKTDLDMFKSSFLLFGEEVYKAFAGGHHEISGFLQGLEENNIEAVPIFYASTPPTGTITRETCDELMKLIFNAIEDAGGLDGMLVAPHGANAGEGDDYRDLDGHWLSRLRETVGAEFPIICTIDPHANLSPRMVAACNATIAYRSTPHLDQKERGIEAAELLVRMLRGEIKPTQAASFVPLAMNIESMYTREAPCLPMYELADQLLSQPGVLSNSIVQGFPYADVEEMGVAFISVTDNKPELAQKLSDQLADYLVTHRKEFAGQFISIEDAVDQALSIEGPVCLLDMGDNAGGGSAGDGTVIAHEILRRGEVKAFLCLYDSESVSAASDVGVGKRIKLGMGGKVDNLHGSPIEAEVTVRSLHDGKFQETEVRHGGHTEFDMGPTAIVETDSGLTVSLTTRRIIPVSLGLMTSCDLDPAAFHIIIAKGVHSPVPAYAPVCKSMIRVNTPGATTADIRNFEYHHRRKPLYPLEEIE